MKFRLVDKITSWSPWNRITGIKAVSFEEYSLKEVFADQPRLPEMLLLESLLQLGNWLVVLSSDFQQMGMVARLSEVRFQNYLLPGQKLQLEVRLMRRREDGFELAGEGRVQGGPTVISGTGCLASVARLDEYQSPADMQVLFSEIYEPQSQTALAAEPGMPPPCFVAQILGGKPAGPGA